MRYVVVGSSVTAGVAVVVTVVVGVVVADVVPVLVAVVVGVVVAVVVGVVVGVTQDTDRSETVHAPVGPLTRNVPTSNIGTATSSVAYANMVAEFTEPASLPIIQIPLDVWAEK